VTAPARVRASACAKINLWLRVLGRDAKGYHAIESLFQLVSLADELVVERAGDGVLLPGRRRTWGPSRRTSPCGRRHGSWRRRGSTVACGSR